jgi:hypothetical protein
MDASRSALVEVVDPLHELVDGTPENGADADSGIALTLER